MAEPDLAALRAGLLSGRDDAFAALIRQFGPALFAAARTMVGNQADAEDVVQDLFVGLVTSRVHLARAESMTAYLFTALRRTAARAADKRLRAERARKEWSSNRDLDAARQSNAPDDQNESLRRAVASLPFEDREVLAYKLDGGLTFREIGALLDISPNTAASRYRYALERLRRALKEAAP